ncbi:MAG: galactokinase [Clostridia bacterium]|nr:galactokinase [Clostridia bacterium]
MKPREAKRAITDGAYDELFFTLYGQASPLQKERYLALIDTYTETFGGEDDIAVFSAPGRTEIGGNHTDHNRGRVLAGSVDLDVIAVASKTSDSVAHVYSKGFAPDDVDLDDQRVYPAEQGHSAALLRGIARALDERGYKRGGYKAVTVSNVPRGSGVSSSAAFEVLLTTIQNAFYNDNKIPAIEVAKISQYAERAYFGKPCGLMDQAACAVGGICMFDFADEANPTVTPVPFRFDQSGYKLCLVSVGGDHSDLTDAYAAIPARMKQVAGCFGKEFLNEVTLEDLTKHISSVREKCGDDAVLAALHFLRETERVPLEREALLAGDFPRFLKLVTASGHSSFEYLQNVLVPRENACQGAAIALFYAAELLADRGAWRIHGGGFGGTTQNFVPDDLVPAFRETMDGVFGEGACHVLLIRPVGPVQVI